MVRPTKVPVKRIPTPKNNLLTNCPSNLETEKVANASEDAEKKSSGQTSILSFMTKKKDKESSKITTKQSTPNKDSKMTTKQSKTIKDSKMMAKQSKPNKDLKVTTTTAIEAQSILVPTLVSPSASISSSGYSSVEDNSLCVICNKSFKSRGCHYTKATISIAGMKRRFCEYFDISTTEVDSKTEDFLRKEKYPFCPSCFALVNDLYRRAEQVQIALKGFMKTKSDVIKATLEGRANSEAASFSSRPYFDLIMKIINQKDQISLIGVDQKADNDNCDEEKSPMIRENFAKDAYLKGMYESTETEEISKSISKFEEKNSNKKNTKSPTTPTDDNLQQNYVIKRKCASSSDSDSSDSDIDDKNSHVSHSQVTSQNKIVPESPKTKFQQNNSSERKISSSDSSSSDSEEEEETHCGQVSLTEKKIPAHDSKSSIIPKLKVQKENQKCSESSSESEESDGDSFYKDKKITDINSHLSMSTKRNSSLSNPVFGKPKPAFSSSAKPSESQQFNSEKTTSKKINRAHDAIKKCQDQAPISKLSPLPPFQEPIDKITSAKRRLNFSPLTEGKKFKSICIPSSNSNTSHNQDSSSADSSSSDDDEDSDTGLNLNKKPPIVINQKKQANAINSNKNVKIPKHVDKSQESFSEDEYHTMADDAVIEKSEAEYAASVNRKSPTFFASKMLNDNPVSGQINLQKKQEIKFTTNDNLRQDYASKRKHQSSSDSYSSDSDSSDTDDDENSSSKITSQNKIIQKSSQTKFQQNYSNERKISSSDSSSSDSEEDEETRFGQGPLIKYGRELPTLANDFKSSQILKPKVSKEKQKSSSENSSEDSDDPSFYRDKKLTDFRSTFPMSKRLSNPALENPKPSMLPSAKLNESKQFDSEKTMSKKVNRAHDAIKKCQDPAPITAKPKTKLSAANKSKPSVDSQEKVKISSTKSTKKKSGPLNLDAFFNTFQKSSKPSK